MQHAFSPFRVAVATATALTCHLVTAQVKFPVDNPAPQVGEVATYRVTDAWNGKELRTAEVELVEVQAEQFVVRVVSPAGAEPRTAYFTRHWQPCRSLQGSDQRTCAGSLKFPMQLGGTHTFEKLPWPNGQGHISSKCDVVAEEKVTVRAGAFDAVKVECKGTWSRVFGGTFSGRQNETMWYAPAVSRLVKNEYVSYTSSGQMDTREVTELVELKKK